MIYGLNTGWTISMKFPWVLAITLRYILTMISLLILLSILSSNRKLTFRACFNLQNELKLRLLPQVKKRCRPLSQSSSKTANGVLNVLVLILRMSIWNWKNFPKLVQFRLGRMLVLMSVSKSVSGFGGFLVLLFRLFIS